MGELLTSRAVPVPHLPARAPRRVAITPRHLALGAFLVAYFSWQLLRWIPAPQDLTGDLLLLAICGWAAGEAFAASRRTRLSSPLARAWCWIGAALAFQTGGEVAQMIYEAIGSAPNPSLADPLYLAFYPSMLIGVLAMPTARISRRGALELAIDCGLVALGGGTLFIVLILGPSAVAADGWLQALVAVAYPIGDMILLVALAAARMRVPAGTTGRVLAPITLAIALFAFGDLVYGFVVLHGVYHGGDAVDGLYVLAFACFLVASWRQPRVYRTEPQPEAGPWDGRESVLPYLAMFAILAVAATTTVDRPLFPDGAVAIVVGLSGGLIVARQLLRQSRLRDSYRNLEEAQEIAKVGSWELDLASGILHRSVADQRLHGRAGVPGETLEELLRSIHPEDRERVHLAFAQSIGTGAPLALEARLVDYRGRVRSLLMRAEAQRSRGVLSGLVGTDQDVTERHELEAQLRYQARHDPLTGLLNRHRFAEILAQRLRARDTRDALVLIDVDDFKLLNDAHGHTVGDRALERLAQVLRERCGRAGVLARLDGDEFAMLLAEPDPDRVSDIVVRVQDDLARGDGTPPISLSAGLVFLDGDERSSSADALVAADIALFEAKRSGKGGIRTYRGAAAAAVTWLDRIRTALGEDRFVLHGQPIIDLRTGRVTHRELLLRMRGDSGELIGPGAFIPIAEHFGLISEIDRWVLQHGLERARHGESVSINLSAFAISDPELLALVQRAAPELTPGQVILEITETAALGNLEEARHFVERLKEMGMAVAIDDFGTGFASFAYLKHLPADYVKIDAEFVRDVATNPTDAHVVEAVVNIAHSLGKLTIAEGIESRAAVAVLERLGVDLGQGFHLGTPEALPEQEADPKRAPAGPPRMRRTRARAAARS